jgi:hypothetical protein
MISAADAIEWMTRLAGVCAVLLSIEVLYDRRHFSDGGLMGWPVMRSRHRALVASWFAPGLDRALSYPAFLGFTAFRLLAGLVLAVAPPGGPAGAVLLGCMAAVGVSFQLRSVFGTDGADQLNVIVLLSLFLDAVVGSAWVRGAVLWFLAAQLALAYFVAGVAKLCGETWRDGRALWQIFSTRMYGQPALGDWLKAHPRASAGASWSIMLLETAFPLVFVVPRPLAVVLVASGVMFHVFAAVFMGLNTFFWAFLSVYPALLWCVFQ